MNRFPYLENEKKAKTLSYGLTVVAALFAIFAFFTANNTVLTWLAAIPVVALFYFAMLYLDLHNVQGQSIKKYNHVFLCFATHAIYFAFTKLAGVPGTLSSRFIYALADAALMGGILFTARLYRPSTISDYLAYVVSALVFVASLFDVNILVNLLFIIASIVLAIFSYKENIIAAIYGCVVAILSLLGLFNGQTPTMHNLLHYLSLVIPMLLAIDLYKVVTPKEAGDVNLNVDRSGVNSSATTTRATTAGTKAATSTKSSTKSTATTKSSSGTSYKLDRSWFIADYKDLPYEDLLNAPVSAFKGVSEAMADDLKAAFNIKTIGELANSKFFAWAKEIVEEANK